MGRGWIVAVGLLFGIVIFILMVSSRGGEDNSVPLVEEQDRIVATATLLNDPSMIKLTWFPVDCEVFDGVEVETDEAFVNVRIRVTVDINTCPPGGFSETTIDIGEPVGDRVVFDRAFNDTVAFTE